MSDLHENHQALAIAAIYDERDYQDVMHGTIEQHGHTVLEWIEIMFLIASGARFTKTDICNSKEYAEPRLVLNDVRKIAATALACLEQHGAPFRQWDRPSPNDKAILVWDGSGIPRSKRPSSVEWTSGVVARALGVNDFTARELMARFKKVESPHDYQQELAMKKTEPGQDMQEKESELRANQVLHVAGVDVCANGVSVMMDTANTDRRFWPVDAGADGVQTSPPSTGRQRLLRAMEQAGLDVLALSQKTGVQAAVIESALSDGASSASWCDLFEIAHALEVPLLWLVRGSGLQKAAPARHDAARLRLDCMSVFRQCVNVADVEDFEWLIYRLDTFYQWVAWGATHQENLLTTQDLPTRLECTEIFAKYALRLEDDESLESFGTTGMIGMLNCFYRWVVAGCGVRKEVFEP